MKNFMRLFFFVGLANIIYIVAADTAYAQGIRRDDDVLLVDGEKKKSQVDTEAAYNEGVEALQSGDYDTAVKKFTIVLKAYPGHPATNYLMGMAKDGQGKPKAALRYFRRAVREHPEFVEAREQLAMTYVALGKTDNAEEQLEDLQDMLSKCENTECEPDHVQRLQGAIVRVGQSIGGDNASDTGGDG